MNGQRTKITGITVSNYKSIGREQHIPLGPMTVLVGPNGSGKSNVVDVLTFVRDAMYLGLSGAITDRGGINAVRHKSSRRSSSISIKLDIELKSRPASYLFEIIKDQVKYEAARVSTDLDEAYFTVTQGKWYGPQGLEPKVSPTSLALPTVAGDKRFTPLFDLLSRLVIYSIYPDTLRQPQKYNPDKPMHKHGDNWVSILQDQKQSTWEPEIVAGLNRLTGDIKGLKVNRIANYLVAQFRHKPEGRSQWFDAAQESDGTLRVAGILTALLQEPPLPIIGIEEPELTVHPGALPLLMDYLRQASKQSQVIITTHSPELLDLVKPHEVQVVERTNGATIIRPLAEHQHLAVSDRLLRLGELMTMEGLRQEEQETAK